MAKKQYNFKIKSNKELGFNAVVLQDDTHVIMDNEGLHIGYPKKKFRKIFERQLADRKRKYVFVVWSPIEITALLKGIKMMTDGTKTNVKKRSR